VVTVPSVLVVQALSVLCPLPETLLVYRFRYKAHARFRSADLFRTAWELQVAWDKKVFGMAFLWEERLIPQDKLNHQAQERSRSVG
jgi:hypothetical protein